MTTTRPADVPDDTIKTAKDFAGFASDLTDKEIKQAILIIEEVRWKYAGKANSAKNLEALRDEILTRLADMSVLATVDVAPCFYGEPPELEIVGKIAGDDIHEHGFDHERKRHEVLEANRRGEDYRGQKEPYNVRRDK